MTNVKTNTNRPFVNGAFSRTRTADTFASLMEQAQKIAIGERIADARERSRWTQDNVADHLGLSTRGYQKVEEKGTTSYERCEILADFFDVPGVTALWLYEGRGAGPGVEPSPDPFTVPAAESDLAERLDWIESALQALLVDRGLEHDAPPSEQDRPQRSGS